jgi:hypothetical protein
VPLWPAGASRSRRSQGVLTALGRTTSEASLKKSRSWVRGSAGIRPEHSSGDALELCHDRPFRRPDAMDLWGISPSRGDLQWQLCISCIGSDSVYPPLSRPLPSRPLPMAAQAPSAHGWPASPAC